MNPVNLIVFFTVVWWLVLFMGLPVGVQIEENPEPGHASSAPKNPNIAKKMAITTVIAVALTSIFFYLVETGLLRIVDLK